MVYRKIITLLFLTSGVLESPPILAMSAALGRYRTWLATWFVYYSTQESPQRSALGMVFYPWTRSGLIVPQPRLGNPNLLRGRAHASGPVPCCRRRCHTGETRGHICDALLELICGPPIVPSFCERFCTSRAPRRRTPETQLPVIFQPQDARSHC